MTSFYIFTVLLACCLSTHPYINALLRLRYATLCFWLRMEWGGVGWVEGGGGGGGGGVRWDVKVRF